MQKILIVDDEKSLLRNIGDFLKVKGYRVLTSLTGDKGLELVKTQKPQLMILDLHLKEGPTGTQVLKVAKMVEPDLKVVVLTGFGEESNTKDECISLGADDFLSKPISLKVLAKTIENVLEEK